LGNSIPDLCQSLNQNKNILLNSGYEIIYAEPNRLCYTDFVPNDPYYSYQWAHKKTQAEAAWDIEKGDKNIKIGIIDTGCDENHEDLTNNVDHSLGYDFVDIDTVAYKKLNYALIAGEDYNTQDSDPSDFNGHGTHVSGIIGAEGNNSIGVTGVCPTCTLVPLRAGFSIKDAGGNEVGALETISIVNAICYATENGISVLNMSFGSSDSSLSEKDVIDNAYDNNIVIVAAAGNNSTDSKFYPAAYNNVISVASTYESDQRSYFSNYGNWITVSAPGSSIYSTIPKVGGALTDPSGYRSLDGTSMAAPYVSGLAALILSNRNNLTSADVKSIIANNTDIPNENNIYFGSGRVNVLKAIQNDSYQNPNIIASITYPVGDNSYSQNINITGSATGDTYILYYGQGSYPTIWTAINSGFSITNGLLGTLDITNLKDGRYTIKLTSKNSIGEKNTIVSFMVYNSKDMKAGWPQDVPIFYNVTTIPVQFSVGDLNGDGQKEIVVLDGINKSCYDNQAQSIYIYMPDGHLLNSTKLPCALPFNGYSYSKPVLADLDGDGKKEIIVLGNAGFGTANFGKGFIQIIKSDGSQYKGWPQIINGINGQINVCAADIDLDGRLEIITCSGGAFCSACTPGGQINVFKTDGTYLKGWPYNLPEGYIPRSPIVLSNIDTDQAPEIIFTAFSNSDPNNKPQFTYALKNDGTIVSGFPYSGNYWGWCLAAGDINNDGVNDIMTQTGPINNVGQKMTWNKSNTYIYSPIVISQINNDPDLKLLFGDEDGKAYLTDYEGNILPGWPLQNGYFAADGNHTIIDINGDGKPEICINWVADTSPTAGRKTGLYFYNVDGTLVNGFPKFTDTFTFSSISVDDIDNDGSDELIGVDDALHKIIVLSLNKKNSISDSEWPMPGHDLWQTGSIINNKEKILTNFSDFSIGEDDSLIIRISPSYRSWQNYLTSPISDTSSVSVTEKDGILKIKPLPYWNGTAHISNTVYNSQLTETKGFNITVRHLNHPPYLTKSLPHPQIIEDTTNVTLVNNLADYFNDPDIGDNLSYKCTAIDKGIDSLLILNTGSLIWYPGQASVSRVNKIKSAPVNKITLSNFASFNNGKLKDYKAEKYFKKTKFLQSDSTSNISLIAFPTHNFYGKTRIVIEVSDDSAGTIKDTLLLTVNHKYDPPSPFKINSPEDNSIIELNSYPGDTLVISWEKSSDLGGDSLVYYFYSKDSLQILDIDSTMQTEFKIPISRIKEVLNKNNITNLQGSWTIIASNGIDSTFSTEGFVKLKFYLKPTGVNDINKLPKEFFITQNYPNPFNPTTMINYGLPKGSYVKIYLYNILGQLVKKIVDNYVGAGYHQVLLNGNTLTSGVYIYTIKADGFVKSVKMQLIK
jgi:thermitase